MVNDPNYFTIDNFAKKFEQDLDKNSSMLLGYLYAIDNIMPDLKSKIEASKNFEELKSELLKSVTNHIATRDFIDNEWQNNRGKYGLPYLPQ